MDININDYYQSPAIVSRAEDAEENIGFVKRFGRTLDSYIDAAGLEITPTLPFSNTNIVSDSITSTEEENSKIEIASTSGSIRVEINEDDFIFNSEADKEAYINAVNALLDSTNGYFEFSSVYANAASFPIPNSPRYTSEMLFRLIEEFRANADPITPYVRPMDGIAQPDSYFTKEVDGKVYNCRKVELALGMEVCSEAGSKFNVIDVDAHTLATSIYGLGIIAQEFGSIGLRDLTETFIKIGETFSTRESIEQYLRSILEEQEKPKTPRIPYPYDNA
jgi:hypothetical protein